jgi:hypothetical protein
MQELPRNPLDPSKISHNIIMAIGTKQTPTEVESCKNRITNLDKTCKYSSPKMDFHLISNSGEIKNEATKVI